MQEYPPPYPPQQPSQPQWQPPQQPSQWQQPQPSQPYQPYPPYPRQPSQPFPQQPYPPQQPLQPQQQGPFAWFTRMSRAAQVGIGCGALLAACMVCGGVAAIVGSAGGGTTAQTTTQATDTPKPTANPNAGYQAYATMVAADLAPLSKDSTDIGHDCGAENLPACRADAVQFQTDIKAMQSDLDAHPAPPCLATTDAHIRSALDLYSQGATDLINGIDQTDASLIQKAGTEMQTGTTEMNSANSSLSSAHC